MLNESYGNLSFAGSGAATGLELVLKNPSKPKIILIEINVIRERDEQMIRDLFSPFLFYLKKYFPFLRQKYQPATVLANSFLKEDKSLSSNVDESVFKIGFDNQKKGQENIPDTSYIDKQIVEISSLIRSAEKDHVKVIFYEMPVHPDLATSRSSVFIREKMLTAFPPNEYDWLPHPEDSKYQTTDGVHLTGASAIVFAQWLQNEISHKQAK